MLNIGGGEVIVILLVALIVLGPANLPDAVRQVGKALGEFRKLSAGLQEEFSDVLDLQTEEDARARGKAVAESTDTTPSNDTTPDEVRDVGDAPIAESDSSNVEESTSTDETA
ncbi:MAG: twin-arginine translocase TatA/TatE family subunit [Acidobacteria bacterium]|nr:twin-arginine translocase TatA/TatE family subunit [Acidobacteriota bacterium]